MKKLFFLAYMACFVSLQVLAQDLQQTAIPDDQNVSTVKGTCSGNFVDSNNNGICDNHENNQSGCCKGKKVTDKNTDAKCIKNTSQTYCNNGKKLAMDSAM